MRKPLKLTWQQVRELRLLSRHEAATYKELAEHFGISASYVATIVNGTSWKEPGYIPRCKPRAKLGWPEVREIRRRYAEGERGCKLAREFGVSNVNVHFIVAYKHWRNDPEGNQPFVKAA
jgi:hypothetical protein